MLVLDDVFQSVDAGIRLRTVEYLLNEFRDWQLIFTVHDRLWQEQLREALRRAHHPATHFEIIRWSFEHGPTLLAADREPRHGLRVALESGAPYQICAEAGLLLEQASQILSYSIPVSVTRRKGDRYTLGDLWPPVAKALRKTELADAVEAVDRWTHLRNLLGAHYNDWTRVLSRQEAEEFGRAVAELVDRTNCRECGRWIEELRTTSGTAAGWTCRCGQCRVMVDKPV